MAVKNRGNNRVFLNVPYDSNYEPVLLAMTAALLSLGQMPELAFDDQRGGEDRLTCIVKLIKSCSFSFHDLSADQCDPPRFNMPFELGMACAVNILDSKARHPFCIFHKTKFRLGRTLTDMNGMDPFIYDERKPESVIRAILGFMKTPNRKAPLKVADVFAVYGQMKDSLALIKKENMADDCSIFDKQIYKSLVASGLIIVHNKGWI
jgi:hypothetical protein